MTRRTTEGKRFDFLVPSAAMILHALTRESRDDETYHGGAYDEYGCDDYDSDDYDCDDEDREDAEYRKDGAQVVDMYNHRVWWMWDDDCEAETCNCGQTSLLLVLEYVAPEERAELVMQHAEEMRGLYEHFWAGQGLVSGASRIIGEACSSCLIEGAAHVWDVYESACELAEEFGEALAAYAYKLFVGEPLHRHENVN